MKLLSAIAEFVVKAIAGSIIWLIVAVILSFPIGLVLLKICENATIDNVSFYETVDDRIDILYLLFVGVSFIGIIIARVVAVSIKTLAELKTAKKASKE